MMSAEMPFKDDEREKGEKEEKKRKIAKLLM